MTDGAKARLVLERVSVAYRRADGSAVEGLRDLDLCLEGPAIVGLIGPNGSGKTTLSRVVCGALAPDVGVCRRPSRLLILSSAYESRGLSAESEWDYLRATSDARLPALGDQALGFRVQGETAASLIRMGGRRRLLRVAALVALRSPGALVLSDEEFGEEDRSWLPLMVDAARASGSLLIMVTHDLDIVRDYCDVVLRMRDGGLMAVSSCENAIEEGAELRTSALEGKVPRDRARNGRTVVDLETVGVRARRSRQAASLRRSWIFRNYSDSWCAGEFLILNRLRPLARRALQRLLLGSISADEGGVVVGGAVSVVGSTVVGPPSMTLRDAARFMQVARGLEFEPADLCLSVFGIDNRDRMEQEVATLSSGQLVRLSCFFAFQQDPALVLLTGRVRHGDQSFRARLTERLSERLSRGAVVASAAEIEAIEHSRVVELPT